MANAVLVLQVIVFIGILVLGHVENSYQRQAEKSLDSLCKVMHFLSEDMIELQSKLIQVQKSEKDNALAVKATQERIGALQNIEANDVKLLTDDIAIIADMMAQMKFTSYRPNDRFQDDMDRILELAKQSRGER
ncbi:hypothetical protein ABVC46_02825 [Lactobacillus crispatus]|uniref:hypothetical protein n=1 Tax=Lactobacillus crispatus TaxID=47770 RepID=UPI001F09F4B5|nr:hypothetical protein [Lactobacillus crispatus]MCT7687501.1 hypothetical protein [Lactobacillus crispatus]MCT7731900.1 hypothetical protein [Lactobacillus crispatus]MCT7742462.1 hypothetical protein [Lactobacillus crispatus]MCT7749151.1 hypothetical protein [Lactobacillus crispatus]MCT7788778.1 hypothetical protein [Lactobacillus crispatus]